MIKRFVIILTLLAFCASNASAIFAPRAMGMGGAYTAIADDPFAAYYNPAGFAINPGVDISSSYQINNRNTSIGDNAVALKGCFEIEMNPFAWILGVGLASAFAYKGAKYLSDKGVVKKGWSRPGETFEKEESVAESVKEEEEARIEAGEEIERKPISRKEIAKKAVKEIGRGTIHVADEFVDAAMDEAARQSRYYYYTPPWYRPNYYRPYYWDDRYNYREKEITPSGKAQFAIGLSVMSDRNDLLNQNTNWYTLSVASGYEQMVALGANLNIYDLELTNFTPKLRGFGAGFDMGALLRISDALFLGVAAKDVLTTDIKFENGAIRRYQMKVNTGIALKPIQQVTLAADAHNIFGQGGSDPTTHYGVEVRPIYGLALRAGLDGENKTAGLSLGIGQLIMDYTYLGGTYNRTQMVGLTWQI